MSRYLDAAINAELLKQVNRSLEQLNDIKARELATAQLDDLEARVTAERRRRGLADIIGVDADGTRRVIGSVRNTLPAREEFP